MPSATRISFRTPGPTVIGISIFMHSMMRITAPSASTSPSAAWIFQTFPASSARTSVLIGVLLLSGRVIRWHGLGKPGYVCQLAKLPYPVDPGDPECRDDRHVVDTDLAELVDASSDDIGGSAERDRIDELDGQGAFGFFTAAGQKQVLHL